MHTTASIVIFVLADPPVLIGFKLTRVIESKWSMDDVDTVSADAYSGNALYSSALFAFSYTTYSYIIQTMERPEERILSWLLFITPVLIAYPQNETSGDLRSRDFNKYKPIIKANTNFSITNISQEC